MKRLNFILSVMFMLLFGINSTTIADNNNYLSIENFTATQGSQVTVPILMTNAQSITAFQAELILPAGVTIAKDAEGDPLIEFTNRTTASKHSLTCNIRQDGAVMIVANSMTNKLFLGNSGAVINVTLNVASTASIGDKTIYINNQELTMVNLTAFKTTTSSATMTIESPIIKVSGITLDKSSLNLTEGETSTLTATVQPTDATNKAINWTSSNTNVATVSNGTITAVAAGTATITATAADGSGIMTTCAVTVEKAEVKVTTITLDKTSLTLTEGDISTLTATVQPTDATNKAINWTSSNTNVATVSNGTITAVAAGTATITATAADGSGVNATCEVSIISAISYIITSTSDRTVKVTSKPNGYSGTCIIPETVTYNGVTYSVTTIGSSAFRNCTSLTSVTIPNCVTSIDEYAFEGCSSLISVAMSSNLTRIGPGSFIDCSNLTSITIPNSVTNISFEAFESCSSLTTITIPNSVASIGWYAFWGCTSLTDVYIEANTPHLDNGNIPTSCVIHVKKGLKDIYKASEAWGNYTIVDDIPIIYKEELKQLVDSYSETEFVAGSAPGFYNEAKVNAYNKSVDNAKTLLMNTATEQEYANALDDLRAKHEDVENSIVPLTKGYYYIVSAGKGSGYPFSDEVKYDDEKKYALYNKDGLVYWKAFDESLPEEIYEFTADGNDNWYVKNIVDGTYINKGLLTYYCDVTTTTKAATAQTFEPSAVVGKWTAKPAGNLYVYVLVAGHNGANGKTSGKISIWGTADEANQGKMSLWYLIPVSEEAVETAKKAMASGPLNKLIADIEAENLQGSDAPGYYTTANIATLNAALETAKAVTTGDDMITALETLKNAYTKATSELNPITEGYYYLVSKYAAYETQFGVPAAMYIAPADVRTSGLSNVRFEKFDENNAHYIFHLTAKKGVEGGFYAQSVMDQYYLNTGDGDDWYGEITTATSKATNAQIFKNYGIGMFWIADETDRYVSRVVRKPGIQNGTIYGWTQFSDNIIEADQWYNAWELVPVTANKVADIVAAQKIVDEAAATVREELREYALTVQDKVNTLIADESELNSEKKTTLKNAWSAVVAAVNAKNYDIVSTAQTLASIKENLEAALADTKEYWKVTSITLDQSTLTITEGNTATLVATVAPEDAFDKTVSWASSDVAVATVSSGTITAVAPGTATITVTAADGSGVKATCTVTVEKAVVKVTSITLDKTSVSIVIGQTSILTATVAPTDATNKDVIWTSSATSIATVSNGIVTAVAPGTAIITATAADGNDILAQCEVTVNPILVNNIVLDITETTIEKASTLALVASVYPDNATNKVLRWTSTNESVATVTDKGLVIGNDEGTTCIVVTSTDGSEVTDTCYLVVEDPDGLHGILAPDKEYKIYDVNGRIQSKLQKGINIILFLDGTRKKIIKK